MYIFVLSFKRQSQYCDREVQILFQSLTWIFRQSSHLQQYNIINLSIFI